MKLIKDNKTDEKERPAHTASPRKVMINRDMLPSRGRYYDSDLYARKLSAIEMKNLSKITVETADSVFNRVISDAISGIDVDRIMKNDKLWLIYFLRSLTYNDLPIKVQAKCPSCKESSWYEYRLANLDVTYADRDLVEELTLPNGDKITVGFTTIGDEREITSTKNNPAYIEHIDSDLMTVTAYVKTINGARVSIYEGYEYFTRGKGSAMDYSKLLSHLKKFGFGARPYGKFTCKCGKEVYADIVLDHDFFLPDIPEEI